MGPRSSNTLVNVATEQSFALDDLCPRSVSNECLAQRLLILQRCQIPIADDVGLLQDELDGHDRWRTSFIEELQAQLRALIAAEVTASLK